MFLNPNRDEQEFWRLLKSYIGTVANGLVANDHVEDLVQDSLFQILTSMGRFVQQPDHKGSSFSRWVCGVTFRRAGNLKRDVYGAREVPVSQMGTHIDGDKWEPADLNALEQPHLNDTEYDDSLNVELWPALVKSTLARTRDSIPPRDVGLFEMIRKSGEISSSALATGLVPNTAYSRVRSWAKLAASPGARPSSRAGVPRSTQPGEQLALACVLKNPAAMVIRDAWRFSRPVVVMPAAEFDAIADRGYTSHSA
jgi:DNA-directed RNA polymerase specialized sigma24 family protein